MRCPKCQLNNESDAKFCAGCGSPLIQVPGQNQPFTAYPQAMVRCQSCGGNNPPDNAFCETCGAPLRPNPPVVAAPVNNSRPTPQKTSVAWWLLPLFFSWVGGIIAWAIVRENDKTKARNLLIFGIIMSVIWLLITIVISLAGYFSANNF
jgi:hypothetical protein